MVSDDISSFTKIASCCAVLPKEEEKELIKASQAGDKTARNKLIKHNLKLVISIAKKYTNQGLNFEDLIVEGMIGLDRIYY